MSSIREPRVLIISNNALSNTKNNGKTIASFFKDFSTNKISQLYFNSEMPGDTRIDNFFQITDGDIISSYKDSSHKCGSIIKQNKLEPKIQKSIIKNSISIFRKSNLARIIRETLWKFSNWNSPELNKWLEEISPEVVFFCAGDSEFAYRITDYICKKYSSKLVVYITDDYILPRKTINPFWWYRRNNILYKMKRTLKYADLFITISEKMRKKYNEYLGKDSIVSVNMSESLRDNTVSDDRSNSLELVYTGGLHYKRYLTLELLAKAIDCYNNETSILDKAYLRIYSITPPSTSVMSKLNIPGACSFEGSLNYSELKNVLNKCDIPVHVESFDRKSIESTRLSISTKIPEYLSLGKPILAIGPEEVASMDYLKKVAFCITNPNSLDEKLFKLLKNKDLRNTLANYSREKYFENHNANTLSKEFKNKIVQLID